MFAFSNLWCYHIVTKVYKLKLEFSSNFYQAWSNITEVLLQKPRFVLCRCCLQKKRKCYYHYEQVHKFFTEHFVYIFVTLLWDFLIETFWFMLSVPRLLKEFGKKMLITVRSHLLMLWCVFMYCTLQKIYLLIHPLLCCQYMHACYIICL